MMHWFTGSQTWWLLLLGTMLLFGLPLLDQRISEHQSPSVVLTMLHVRLLPSISH